MLIGFGVTTPSLIYAPLPGLGITTPSSTCTPTEEPKEDKAPGPNRFMGIFQSYQKIKSDIADFTQNLDQELQMRFAIWTRIDNPSENQETNQQTSAAPEQIKNN